MAKKIIWTKRANKRFNKITDYLQKEWGEKVTENFVVRGYDVIELLSEYPNMGTLENSKKAIRGFLITKHNRLFYRVTEKELVLLNFFDTRQRKNS